MDSEWHDSMRARDGRVPWLVLAELFLLLSAALLLLVFMLAAVLDRTRGRLKAAEARLFTRRPVPGASFDDLSRERDRLRRENAALLARLKSKERRLLQLQSGLEKA